MGPRSVRAIYASMSRAPTVEVQALPNPSALFLWTQLGPVYFHGFIGYGASSLRACAYWLGSRFAQQVIQSG